MTLAFSRTITGALGLVVIACIARLTCTAVGSTTLTAIRSLVGDAGGIDGFNSKLSKLCASLDTNKSSIVDVRWFVGERHEFRGAVSFIPQGTLPAHIRLRAGDHRDPTEVFLIDPRIALNKQQWNNCDWPFTNIAIYVAR